MTRFHVDAWDPTYGSSGESTDDESTARVQPDVERAAGDWAPVDPPGVAAPSAVLFVDGVRRVDARVWVEDAGGARPGLCATYAAGVVCCSGPTAQVVSCEVRRGLFTAAQATDVGTSAAAYPVERVASDEGQGLSLGLQRRLAELETSVALSARAGLAGTDDLLVVDGPLRGRQHLPRSLGLVKTHHASYLPAGLDGVVAALGPAQRTPVFHTGTSWERYCWYLRLPCPPGAPWAGVVRLECAATLPVPDAVGLAGRSQVALPRYASVAYKDARAPQNLYPVGGLERRLRARLGDPQLLHRSLTAASRH